MKAGLAKRYLVVVGAILVVLAGLGVWLKPPVAQMEEAVGQALAEYARAKTEKGEAAPVVSSSESRDWIVAVSHVAKVGEETFSCAGGFKVTFCFSPDVE